MTICHKQKQTRDIEKQWKEIGEGFWNEQTECETKLNKPFGTLSDHKMTKCLHDGAIKSST